MSNKSKVEFAVQMGGQGCANKVEKALENVGEVEIDMKLGRVIINSTLSWSELQEKIQKTGRKAVLSGFGEKSAVAVIEKGSESVKGVIRFSIADDKKTDGCVVDGVIDGLKPGLHGLHIHECGDLSDGCASLGNHYNPRGSTQHGGPNSLADKCHAGDLGNVNANDSGRATFRFISKYINVWEIIGRSVVVTENADDYGNGDNKQSLIDGNSGERIACGIIARSAGIFENFKKICACDGVTIWDENNSSFKKTAAKTTAVN